MPDQSSIAPSMYDDAADRRPARPVRIAVSSCLLGNHVRYDGGHKRDEFLVDVLAHVCELVPVCPEVAIGLGVPRPPIRLLGDLMHPHARGVENNELDVTAALTRYAAYMARELHEISGYVFKSKSPSCGIRGVKVHVPGIRPASTGVGVFARKFMTLRPLLPVEDEVRLARPGLRDCFIERVFACRRWQDLVASGITRPRLARFHAMHKLTFMAHGSTQHPHLELAVNSPGRALPALIRVYQRDFMRMLQQRATRRRHVRVLKHVTRHLVTQLQLGDRVELRDAINAYALGRSPRFVPITLLRHHLRHFPHPDLVDQIYLNPRPEELMLYHPRG
ncbi:MAG: YbgA family protein [Acidiferrobacterales bacterium]